MCTYETQDICAWTVCNVFHQVPARHPNRNEPEGVDCDTQKWNDVWVRRVFPHHGHTTEGLQSSLENGGMGCQEHTSLAFCGSPAECVLSRLIHTLEPPRVPSYTSPGVDGRPISRRECENVQDLGSNSLMPHIFPSSCRVS